MLFIRKKRWDLEWRHHSRSLPFEVPPCRHSRSLGIKSRAKIVKFWGFLDPYDQNEQYHNPSLSKI